jgi:hypothetical protein
MYTSLGMAAGHRGFQVHDPAGHPAAPIPATGRLTRPELLPVRNGTVERGATATERHDPSTSAQEALHEAQIAGLRELAEVLRRQLDDVRRSRRLKTLAAEQEREVEDMVSEALNLLFARYRKAEIAPRS